MFQDTELYDTLPCQHSVKIEKYTNSQQYLRQFKGALMAIEEMQKELVEQGKQHERIKKDKKDLQNKLNNKKIKHQLKMKHCKEKIEELEKEVKRVEKTKYALIEDWKFAKEYLANQARNNIKEVAHLYHLRWLIKLQRAWIEKLENSASAPGPPDAVESAKAIKTTTPVVRQHTKKHRVKVVRQ